MLARLGRDWFLYRAPYDVASLFYPARRGSWWRLILLIEERGREREERRKMGRVYFHRFGRTREGNDSRRRRCSRGMESVVGKMPCGMRVPRMEDGEIVFIQADLFTSSFLRADHSFPYLRIVPLPFSFLRERDNTSATSSWFSFLCEFEDCSIIFESHFFFTREIVNFRKENLSRDACSGIVNRNIDNYGHNVSRTMYH